MVSSDVDRFEICVTTCEELQWKFYGNHGMPCKYKLCEIENLSKIRDNV